MRMNPLNKTEQDKANFLIAKQLLKTLKQSLDAKTERAQKYLEHSYNPG